MNRANAESFRSLAHRSVARVDVIGDVVELAVPESEGWRLVISAAIDERGQPTLVAQWKPGVRHRHRHTLKRMAPRDLRGALHNRRERFGRRRSHAH